jgi:hypothetical protein
MRLALNNTLNSITSKEFSNNYSMNFYANEYLALGDTLNLGTDNFSIAFWTKLDDADDQGFISKEQGSDDFWRVRTIASTKELYVVGKSGGVTAFAVTGGADVTPLVGSWIHVCVSVDRGGDINLYVNGDGSDTTTYGGSATISGSSSVDIDNTGQLEMGRFGTTSYLDGKMDEVAIWDVALDGDTVDSIYNSGTPNDLTLSASYTAGSGVDKSGNLLSYWRMGDGIYDSGSGEVIFDQETPTIGENLITDPIFATGTGWTAVGGSGLISERSTENPQSGDYSWKYVVDGVAVNEGVATSTMTVEPNTIYKFSYWGYAPSTNTSNRFHINKQAGNIWTVVGGSVAHYGQNIPFDTWTEVSAYFRTASSGTTIRVRLGNGGTLGADGDVRYFDNVSMVKIGGNPAIMENMDSSNIVTDTP